MIEVSSQRELDGTAYTLTVVLVCPICRERVKCLQRQYISDAAVVQTDRDVEWRHVDLSEHFEQVQHTELQWRDAFFLDPALKERGKQPTGAGVDYGEAGAEYATRAIHDYAGREIRVGW